MKALFGKILLLGMISATCVGLGFYTTYFRMPPAFAESYQKGFNYQYGALLRADAGTPKVIVLGGSYMTFATDSAMLSKLTGRPAYTLGIHSGMGMCYIIETARQFIRTGDTVVYSFMPFKKDDYGMDLIYLSFEGEPELFADFLRRHPFAVCKSIAPAIYTKLYNNGYEALRRMILHWMGIDRSVYSASAFDPATGNLTFDRPAPDPDMPQSALAPWRYSITDIDPSCVAILNGLDDFCRERGAAFYITYPAVYAGCVTSSEKEAAAYEAWLSERLTAPAISTIAANEFPMDCVYNGSLHMNDRGAERYTRQLADDLRAHVPF